MLLAATEVIFVVLILFAAGVAYWAFMTAVGGCIDLIEAKKYKKLIKNIISVSLAVVVIGGIGTYFLTSTDYFKMRRKPEENEFYGKTVNEMRQKYYCPQDGDYWYKDDGYVQCVAYLRDNDWLDGIKFYDRYYVKTDENGIITDVMVVKDD